MNKQRIQELALQAGAKLGPYVHEVDLLQPDGTYQWNEDRHTDTTTIDLEKFAELIVQECANFVENIFDDDGGHAPCEDYAKGIKKHFGVEE